MQNEVENEKRKPFTGLIPPMVTPLNAKRELDKAAVRLEFTHFLIAEVRLTPTNKG